MKKDQPIKKRGKRVEVTSETTSGRNTEFVDKITGEHMTRAEFVAKIKSGIYTDYYVRKQNGILTPVSKPDGETENNLG